MTTLWPCADGGLKPKRCSSRSEKVCVGNFGDADGAIALHVGVAAHRANAGAVASHIAAQQRKIGKLLHIVRAALVLRDAHAIDDDGALRLHVGVGRIFEIFARQSGLALDRRAIACA